MTAQEPQGSNCSAVPMAENATPAQIAMIGLGLLAAFLFFFYLLVALWPTKAPVLSVATAQATLSPGPLPTATTVPTVPGQNAGEWNPHASLFGVVFTITSDVRFILIVAIAAALGGFIQTATSFTTFLGNRAFRRSWVWWYVLRVPIGMALALLFYFAIRGGFFTSVSSTDINPFGMAALGGLVGMFSRQASDKLQDVFEQLFKSDQDQARADKIAVTPPAITSTMPATLTTGSAEVILNGTGFVQGAAATVNGQSQVTTFVDASTLRVTLPSPLTSGSTLQIVVTNPGPAGTSSAPYSVTVA
jgi:hypothetical protein